MATPHNPTWSRSWWRSACPAMLSAAQRLLCNARTCALDLKEDSCLSTRRITMILALFSCRNRSPVQLSRPANHGIEKAHTWSANSGGVHVFACHRQRFGSSEPGDRRRGISRNSFNLRAERGNSDFDIRHRLVINYLYEIPLGRGPSAWARVSWVGCWKAGRWLGSQRSRWQPFQIFSTRDNQHAGRNDLAQLVGNPKQPAGVDKTFTGPAVSALTEHPSIKHPICPESFLWPGRNTWDVVAEKRTTITERFKLDFKTEVYNIFNRVNFGQPDTSAISGPGLSLSTQFGNRRRNWVVRWYVRCAAGSVCAQVTV